MNENLKQPKYYNRFKNYLKEKDINTNKIIHAIKEVELSPGGGTNVGYGLPLPLYTPDPDSGSFLTVDEEGKISNIGQVNEHGILLNVDENDFNIIWALNKTSGIGIPKGAVTSTSSNRTEALSFIGDLSEIIGNTHHASGSFIETLYKDVDNETELAVSNFINLPDFTVLQLSSNEEEIISGFANGNLSPGSYTETLHFPRFFSVDSNTETEYKFGLVDGKVVFLHNDDPIFKLPNTSPDYKGKTFTSGTILSDLEWKFIDENRVKSDTSGNLIVTPDYNEGNVLELTNVNTGPLELELPINMPTGADMCIRILPSTLTSFTPDIGYIFNIVPPSNLEANKLIELKIREFQGNYYINFVTWS